MFGSRQKACLFHPLCFGRWHWLTHWVYGKGFFCIGCLVAAIKTDIRPLLLQPEPLVTQSHLLKPTAEHQVQVHPKSSLRAMSAGYTPTVFPEMEQTQTQFLMKCDFTLLRNAPSPTLPCCINVQLHPVVIIAKKWQLLCACGFCWPEFSPMVSLPLANMFLRSPTGSAAEPTGARALHIWKPWPDQALGPQQESPHSLPPPPPPSQLERDENFHLSCPSSFSKWNFKELCQVNSLGQRQKKNPPTKKKYIQEHPGIS